MSAVRGVKDPVGAPARDERAQLRRLAHRFEGVFMNQLFQVMRQSVPDNGFIEKSQGEDMFTAMLDQRLADTAAQRVDHGLGEALYRQLVKRLDAAEGTEGGKTP